VCTPTVACSATDKAGTSNCCSFTVTVRCQTNCVKVVCPFFFVGDGAHPNLHSFPTRRSSDLPPQRPDAVAKDRICQHADSVELRSEEHTSELQSLRHLVCRLLLEKKKSNIVVNCAGPNGAVVSYKPYATNICTGAELPLVCTP